MLNKFKIKLVSWLHTVHLEFHSRLIGQTKNLQRHLAQQKVTTIF